MPFFRYPQTHPPLPGLGPPPPLHPTSAVPSPCAWLAPSSSLYPLSPARSPPLRCTPACSLRCRRPGSGASRGSWVTASREAGGGSEGSGGGRHRELRTRWSELDRPLTICHHLNLNARQPPIVMLIRGWFRGAGRSWGWPPLCQSAVRGLNICNWSWWGLCLCFHW